MIEANEQNKLIEALQRIQICSSLKSDDLRLLLSKLQLRKFAAGEVLVREGQVGDEMYIIVHGEVIVSVHLEDREIELVNLNDGDFFGEMSMLQRAERSASCTATRFTKCLVLNADDFLNLIENYSEMAFSMLEKMLDVTVQRLLTTNSVLSQIIEWGNDAKQRAITDPFTGLFNRRYFDEHFDSLLSQSLRRQLGLSFAMVDIDHFGIMNQKYGAEFCDEVLLKIVELFKKVFNEKDILIRYGGDEFCFIIHGSPKCAEILCKSVCKGINELTFAQHPDLRASCTIGLAHYKSASSAVNLVRTADESLYAAKTAGRNRVFVYGNKK